MVSVNALRKDVSNDKKKVIWIWEKSLNIMRYKCKAKSAISNGNPKSVIRYGRVQRVETILSQKWLVMGTRSTVDKSVP